MWNRNSLSGQREQFSLDEEEDARTEKTDAIFSVSHFRSVKTCFEYQRRSPEERILDTNGT